MSNSNQVKLSYVEESTFGTTPASTLIDLPITSHSLAQQSGFVKSNTIRSDRNIADIIRTDASVSGQIGGELNYSTWDEFMRYSLQSSAWSSAVVSSGSYAIGSSSTVTRASGSFVSDGLVAGQWVKLSGFTIAGNNLVARVSVVAALTLTLSTTALSTESAVSATVTAGASIINGTTRKSISIEENDTDAALFRVFKGVSLNGFDLNVPATGVVTISFDCMGKSEVHDTVTAGTGNTAVNTNPVMNGVSSPLDIYDASTAQTTLTSLSLSVRNNLRPQNAIGTLGPTGIGSGSFNVTGTFSKYFASNTIAAKYLAATSSILRFRLVDSNGAGYLFYLPKIRYTGAPRNIGGRDQDVIIEFPFEAYYDSQNAGSLLIVRHA